MNRGLVDDYLVYCFDLSAADTNTLFFVIFGRQRLSKFMQHNATNIDWPQKIKINMIANAPCIERVTFSHSPTHVFCPSL